MPVKLNGPIPAFVNVTGSEALDVPTFCGANASEVGEILGVCGCPSPLRAAVWAARTYVPEWAATLSVATGAVVTPLGVNVTLIVQVPPAGKVVPQVFVCLKFRGFVPTIAIVIDSGAIPLLDSVAGCGALIVPNCCGTKSIDAGVRASEGATAVPLSATVSTASESVSISVATGEVVTPFGVNVTLIVQLPPTGRVTGVPHVFVCLKFMGFVPPIAIVLILRGAVPLLDTVIVCAALIVPNC